MARTQQERREETIARLLDAAIDTIIEVGYARASAKVIARRAQVSDGALFRHFPTMGDFMAATAREAGRRQLEAAAKRVAEIPHRETDPRRRSDDHARLDLNSTNTVLYELAVAARTDEKLRSALEGVMTSYIMKIYQEVRTALPEEVEAIGEENFAVQLALAVNTFDGAATFRHVFSNPQIEERRIPTLVSLLGAARP